MLNGNNRKRLTHCYWVDRNPNTGKYVVVFGFPGQRIVERDTEKEALDRASFMNANRQEVLDHIG